MHAKLRLVSSPSKNIWTNKNYVRNINIAESLSATCITSASVPD
jgi:hypothetical protein